MALNGLLPYFSRSSGTANSIYSADDVLLDLWVDHLRTCLAPGIRLERIGSIVPLGRAILLMIPGASCLATIALCLRDKTLSHGLGGLGPYRDRRQTRMSNFKRPSGTQMPMVGQPGDKSPGYYRVSLRDEVKTGFQMSKLQRRHVAQGC
jgi:hypothetical protein